MAHNEQHSGYYQFSAALEFIMQHISVRTNRDDLGKHNLQYQNYDFRLQSGGWGWGSAWQHYTIVSGPFKFLTEYPWYT